MGYREVVLEPLGAEAGARLVNNLLEQPGFTAELKGRILAKAEGNPFYLEEIVRTLIDSQVLTFRDGTWVLAAEVGSITIPETVQAVIASRLDRLEKDVREVLQIAAVIGRNFQVAVLERLSRLASLMLTLYLVDLEEHDYLREYKREPDLEYVFSHPLFQEVSYNGLLRKRRLELHRRAGEVIEELYHDRLEDFAEILAYQYAQGDDSGKALEWLRKAGQKARARFANDEAIACYQQVVAILRTEKGDGTKDLGEAYLTLGEIHSLKSDYDAAATCFREAARLFEGDRRMLSRVKRNLARALQSLGKYREALPVLGEAEKELAGDAPEDVTDRATIHFSRSRSHRILGDIELAIRECEKGLALLEQVGSGGLPERVASRFGKRLGEGLMTLGLALDDHGEGDRAIELFQRYLVNAEERDDKVDIGRACNHLGNSYARKGEFDRALAMFQRYLALCQEIGIRQGVAIASNNMGLLYQAKGQADRAMELYRTYLTLSEEMGYRRGVAIACGNLGSMFLEAGEFDRAEEQLLRAEKICQEMGDKPNLIETWCLLAETKMAAADCDGGSELDAWTYWERAYRLAVPDGSREHQAICLFTSGKLRGAFGKPLEAESDFLKAAALFADLKQKKRLANVYLSCAKALRKAPAGTVPEGKVEDYFQKARVLFEEMNLPHKVREC